MIPAGDNSFRLQTVTTHPRTKSTCPQP
jgi:hypothetical protein